MGATHKLLILENSVLHSMAASPAFLKEFPFLAALKAANKTKTHCCHASPRINAAIPSIKSALTALGAEKKKRLKQMLAAEKVRIRLQQGNRVIDHTF